VFAKFVIINEDRTWENVAECNIQEKALITRLCYVIVINGQLCNYLKLQMVNEIWFWHHILKKL